MSPKDVLIKAAVRLEALHQDLHFFHLPEGEVWDDAQQALQHTRVGADKSAVDLVQEHHELIFITCQEEVALQEERGRRPINGVGTSVVALLSESPRSSPGETVSGNE